jgi:thiopurine S-methyltransferase
MQQTIDWHQFWTRESPGFHEGRVNAYLQQFIDQFDLNPGDCVFMPLCGKAHDIYWLWQKGLEVVGVELSPVAVTSFMQEFAIEHEIARDGELTVYTAPRLTLYQGDFMRMAPRHLQACKLVYDRAALVAIESFNRHSYCAHMLSLLAGPAPVLMITLEYDQTCMKGPPFSVPVDEIRELYGQHYRIDELLAVEQIDERPKWREQGLGSFREIALSLVPE